MADGSQKRIERVKAGDQVLTRDEYSGEQGAGKVSRTFVRRHDTLLKIETADGRSIEATPEHPFWAEGKGFVAARTLARSDLLLDKSGYTSAIIRVISRQGGLTVYNFEVMGSHSYFAGMSSWWVHNACSVDCSKLATEAYEQTPSIGAPHVFYIPGSSNVCPINGHWGYHVANISDGVVTDTMLKEFSGLPIGEFTQKVFQYPELIKTKQLTQEMMDYAKKYNTIPHPDRW